MGHHRDNVWATESSAPVGELSEFVQEIERAHASGDVWRAQSLIEQSLLATWYGFEHSRLVRILTSIVDAGAPRSSVAAVLYSFITLTNATSLKQMSVLRGLQDVGTPEAQLLLQLAAMLDQRLQGHSVAALAYIENFEDSAHRVRPIFDSLDPWGVFTAVHTGITAMLAGDFGRALHAFTQAQMFGLVPSLAFLHREAYVRAAMIHAAFGDPERARLLLMQADRVPRTGSWAEAGIDAGAVCARVMTATDDFVGAARALDELDMRNIGELWPFFIVALQYSLEHIGAASDVAGRVGLFDSFPIPKVDGEGFGGSVIPVTLAAAELQQGRVRQAWQHLERADASVISTQVFTAMLHAHDGNAAEAIAIARAARDETKGLRKLEMLRLAALASAYESAGQHDELKLTLSQALELPHGLTALECRVFSAAVNEFARATLERWPALDTTVPVFSGRERPSVSFSGDALELLSLLARGLPLHQVAEELFVPLATVTVLRAQIAQGFGHPEHVSDDVLVLTAQTHGII
ncbi:hypothetical protein ACXR2W_03820 [Leucobacter sp. HY1908]